MIEADVRGIRPALWPFTSMRNQHPVQAGRTPDFGFAEGRGGIHRMMILRDHLLDYGKNPTGQPKELLRALQQTVTQKPGPL
jgi:hypothetical protein